MSSTPIALPAINTYLFLGSQDSPPTFSTDPVANVGDYTGPGMSKAVVDVTSQSNVNPWRQKITTLIDGGDLTMPLFFIPGDSNMQALLAIFGQNGQDGIYWFKLEFTDGTEWFFQASISKWNLKMPVAGVVTADITFTLTGKVVFPA
jgi:Lambda phage tail tube protein, TTP